MAEDERGLASGLLTTAAQVGTALGIAALLAIAAAGTADPAGGGAPSPGALVQGYRWGYIGAAGVSVAGLLTALYLIRRPEGVGRKAETAGSRSRPAPR